MYIYIYPIDDSIGMGFILNTIYKRYNTSMHQKSNLL